MGRLYGQNCTSNAMRPSLSLGHLYCSHGECSVLSGGCRNRQRSVCMKRDVSPVNTTFQCQLLSRSVLALPSRSACNPGVTFYRCVHQCSSNISKPLLNNTSTINTCARTDCSLPRLPLPSAVTGVSHGYSQPHCT